VEGVAKGDAVTVGNVHSSDVGQQPSMPSRPG
jgi:hypothetical protein